MPSEETTARASAALAPAMEMFRSAVTDAAEAVRTRIEALRPVDKAMLRAGEELGAFAFAHIDAERFAALVRAQSGPDERALHLLERARAILAAVAAGDRAPLRVDVPSGTDLIQAAGTALATAGRAFRAARIAELVRLGRLDEALREPLDEPLAVTQWTRGELRIAPPLLIEVDGGDLRAAGLANFLDGVQKVALIVRAPAPPAALARLITPGVFVMQTTAVQDIARLASFDGPAVGAIVPDGCALFVHDPTVSGPARLTVQAWPTAGIAGRIGQASVFQQSEELAHLRALAASLEAGPASRVAMSTEPMQEAPSADHLAAWLLQQTDLAGIA